VLLAQAVLSTQPERIPPLLELIGEDSDLVEKANALRTLGKFAQLADNPTPLPEAKVRQRYLEGAREVKAGDYGAALEAFIQVLERDKQYDNGGAKDACRAIFQLLGTRHPLVERSFRAFSSALHS